MGLQNVRDRLGALDGHVSIATAIGDGTTVSGSIPPSPDQGPATRTSVVGYRTTGMGSTRALDHYTSSRLPPRVQPLESENALQTGPRCRVRAAARRSSVRTPAVVIPTA